MRTQRILQASILRLKQSQRIQLRSYRPEQPFKPFFQPSAPKPPSEGVNDAQLIAMAKQYKARMERKKRKIEPKPVREGSNDEILAIEVQDLLSRPKLASAQPSTPSLEPTEGIIDNASGSSESRGAYYETELEVEELSSTGDGLARSSNQDHVYIVPFSLPGDRVRAKVKPYQLGLGWSHADFLEVLRPSPKREGVTPKCKYFTACSGCQLQMISYEDQLAHKRRIVEKAFRNFSDLAPEFIPAVGPTGASPLQYGYRTKLTPHFDGPPRSRIKAGETGFTEVPNIGFNRKGWNKVMDIENCPIATEIVEEGLKRERETVANKMSMYRKGATLLLRETTKRVMEENPEKSSKGSEPAPYLMPTSLKSLPEPLSSTLDTTEGAIPKLFVKYPQHTDIKTYTADGNSSSTEYVSSYRFNSRAGSFFQNNNSILAPFLSYVRSNAIPKSLSSSSSTTTTSTSDNQPKIKYLLDAYCGSGLFAVTLSPLFKSVLGIDIDMHNIMAARSNAVANNVPNAGFIEADASGLFADVPFPGEESLVVIDPPRKGASEDFLRQLAMFGPKRVVYVSCNVHTQARDVGMLVRGFGEKSGWRYEIESLMGWDFFPQTGHVEGLCFLNRSEKEVENGQMRNLGEAGLDK